MATLTKPVLVVEDDPNTSSLVQTYLEREGFSTVVACDGDEALRLARLHRPGFVILDIMLPGRDGWEVCKELRKWSDVPILMLTAREEEIDRVLGLSMGADDYVVKPFSPRELVERVKAILRRVQPKPAVQPPEVLAHSGVLLDPGRHKVSVDGKPVLLTGTEFVLLQALMDAPGRVFSRQELLQKFYEQGEAVVERVIDVHIGKLRQKLGDDSANPHYILTVRGFGYCFAENEEGDH